MQSASFTGTDAGASIASLGKRTGNRRERESSPRTCGDPLVYSDVTAYCKYELKHDKRNNKARGPPDEGERRILQRTARENRGFQYAPRLRSGGAHRRWPCRSSQTSFASSLRPHPAQQQSPVGSVRRGETSPDNVSPQVAKRCTAMQASTIAFAPRSQVTYTRADDLCNALNTSVLVLPHTKPLDMIAHHKRTLFSRKNILPKGVCIRVPCYPRD